MQYNFHTIKGNNINREKELAKNDFALLFFHLLPFHN